MPAFVPVLGAPFTALRPLAPRIATARVRVSRACRVRPALMLAGAAQKKTVRVGEVVAVERGRGRVSIARVTGVSSAGDTVDVQLLDEFVKELYVQGKEPSTFERTENVRPVVSEYVPTQNGWIVLNQDLDVIKNEFAARDLKSATEPTVVVTEAAKRELDPAALEKQLFPRPTKSQALIGAALSVPLAALCYSAFAGARQAYSANPRGEELMSGAANRQILLFLSAFGSVGALVVGCALLLYALGGAAPDDE